MQIPPYSFGFGDRFSLHGTAFISAIQEMHSKGVDIYPIWNKSHIEYKTTKSTPSQMRVVIGDSLEKTSWKLPYGLDADHVTIETVDSFLEDCNYFTIDVSKFIRKLAHYDEMDAFIKSNQKYIGRLEIPGMTDAFQVFENVITSYAGMYLLAAKKAGELYQYIKDKKKDKPFFTEISMDEVNYSHSPLELFFILKALSFYDVKFQLISPRFIGRFNKNIDYVGSLPQLEAELDMYIKIIKYAIHEFDLDPSLKLSLHSGSDKYSVYPIINKMLKKHQVGIHVKTSGMGWLTSIMYLAAQGGENLTLVKNFYNSAYQDFSNIITHYDKVTDINKSNLPTIAEMKHWDKKDFINSLDIDGVHENYNTAMRQFMACSYRSVIDNITMYKEAVKENLEEINLRIKTNLLENHLIPIFLGIS